MWIMWNWITNAEWMAVIKTGKKESKGDIKKV